MKKDSLIYTVLFSFGFTFLFVFILALANKTTQTRVETYAKLSEMKAFLGAAGINFEENNIEETFSKNFNKVSDSKYEASVNGENIIVTKVSGKGLWSTVNGVLAVNKNIDRIIGFDITSHNETPGLGGRIDEQWFKDQFKNEKIVDKIKIVKGTGKPDTDSENGIIDGITGATLTTNSIETIINKEIETLRGGTKHE